MPYPKHGDSMAACYAAGEVRPLSGMRLDGHTGIWAWRLNALRNVSLMSGRAGCRESRDLQSNMDYFMRPASLSRLFVLALIIPPHSTALAGDGLRDFCADRPGLGTPTCIVDRGHVVIEAGVADWTHVRDGSGRSDSVVLGNTLIRYGLTDTLEVHVGWDGQGFGRVRAREAGLSERFDGGGDMTFAFRQSLRNPDGSGFSVAVMPYVIAATGSEAFSAGDWGSGLLVPLSLEFGNGLSLGLTPHIDAAVDGDGDGRHLAYGSVVGLSVGLTDDISLALEVSFTRDEDPDGHGTEALAGLAFAWMVTDNLQLDLGAVAGLNSESPDAEVYAGIARRF